MHQAQQASKALRGLCLQYASAVVAGPVPLVAVETVQQPGAQPPVQWLCSFGSVALVAVPEPVVYAQLAGLIHFVRSLVSTSTCLLVVPCLPAHWLLSFDSLYTEPERDSARCLVVDLTSHCIL